MILSPLHRAVVENHVELVARLQSSPYRKEREKLGFTPLELAQLLGRKDCLKLLEDHTTTASRDSQAFFSVKMENHRSSECLSREEFERFFSLTYCTHLAFLSYKELETAVARCPYLLRYPALARENHDCAAAHREKFRTGHTAAICIQWIDKVFGYGAFAEEDIPAGAYVGEYTGLVHPVYRHHPQINGYCLRYPTRFWSMLPLVIDSLAHGNVTRFINHSDRPNLKPYCAVDRGLLHQIFISQTTISKGTELTFDYGPDYWAHRQKCP